MVLAEDRMMQRKPLTNFEAEQAFLGALLYRNDVLDQCDVPIEPQHFAEAVHARIFEAASTMIRSGRKADAVTMINHFKADGALDQLGGTAYFARLAASAPSVISAPSYAAAIHDLYLRREAVAIAETAIDELQALPVDMASSDYLAGMALGLSALAENSGTTAKTCFTAGAAVVAAIDSAAVAYQNDGQLPYAIRTGLKGLDAKIGGLVRGNMVVIGARASMGKTAVGLMLACNAARAGTPAQFISLEMRAKEIGDRMAAMALRPRRRVDFSRIAWGRISEDEFSSVVEATREIEQWPLVIEDRSDMGLPAIRAAVARQKVRQPGLGVVVVDYLGLVTPGNRYGGRKVDEVGEISTGLKRIAKQFDVCLIALHQLNRALEGRENKRPTLADLRDSGAIEQDADIVIFPFREAYYLARELDAAEPNSKEAVEAGDRLRKVANDMELIIAKNRQGATATVRSWCDIACNYIADEAPGQEGFL